VFAANWWYSTGLDTTGIYKTDTLGNVLNRKIVSTVETCGFYSSFRTFNNRQVFSGEISLKGTAIKLNSELEFDSIYNLPRIYDSLALML